MYGSKHFSQNILNNKIDTNKIKEVNLEGHGYPFFDYNLQPQNDINEN